MSAVVGLFYFDRRPVTDAMLQPAVDELAQCGGDGSGIWTTDGVGLGHQMRHITPESLHEELPWVNADIAITADGRIDNREELFDQLSVPRSIRGNVSDSKLILSCYQRWGRACAHHLIGEFAFVIWDGRARELFCACDHVGTRPLFYYRSPSCFAIATDVRGLWALPEVPKALNEGEVAGYLVGGYRPGNQTLYHGISRLTLGRYLCVSERDVQESTYWAPFELPEIRLKSRANYGQELRALMDEAVGCRLRTDFPVATHISGGLDSSSIAVLAARHLLERGKQLAMAYSWSHPVSREYPSQPNDERVAILRLAQVEGIPIHLAQSTAEDWYARFHRFPVFGDIEAYGLERAVVRHASALQVRTILTGLWGDQGITNRGNSYLRELLYGGRYLKLFLEGAGCRWFMKRTLGSVFHSVASMLGSRWGGSSRSPGPTMRTTGLVSSEFAASFASELQSVKRFSSQAGIHLEQRYRLGFGDLSACLAEWSNWGSRYGLSHTYPMLDRRVLEFAYKIPSDLFFHNGIGAHLYRSSMGDVLPDFMLWNTSKRDPVHLKQRQTQLREVWLRLRNDAAVGKWDHRDIPYLDLRRLRQTMMSVPSQDVLSHYDEFTQMCRAIEVSNLWDRLFRASPDSSLTQRA